MSGQGPAARIPETVPTEGVLLWCLGQPGFATRTPGALLLIDPFLTDFGSFGRLYPPPLEPEELS